MRRPTEPTMFLLHLKLNQFDYNILCMIHHFCYTHVGVRLQDPEKAEQVLLHFIKFESLMIISKCKTKMLII